MVNLNFSFTCNSSLEVAQEQVMNGGPEIQSRESVVENLTLAYLIFSYFSFPF